MASRRRMDAQQPCHPLPKAPPWTRGLACLELPSVPYKAGTASKDCMISHDSNSSDRTLLEAKRLLMLIHVHLSSRLGHSPRNEQAAAPQTGAPPPSELPLSAKLANHKPTWPCLCSKKHGTKRNTKTHHNRAAALLAQPRESRLLTRRKTGRSRESNCRSGKAAALKSMPLVLHNVGGPPQEFPTCARIGQRPLQTGFGPSRPAAN